MFKKHLAETERALRIMLTNALRNIGRTKHILKSTILHQISHTVGETNARRYLTVLALLNELSLVRSASKRLDLIDRLVDELLYSIPRGILEDAVHFLLEEAEGYLTLLRTWEHYTAYSLAEELWLGRNPERVKLSAEEALEVSERLFEYEQRLEANRKVLAPVLRNLRYLYYNVYLVRRDLLLKRAMGFAESLLWRANVPPPDIKTVAGVATLYAYRSWCLSGSDNFLSLVRYKLHEVLHKFRHEDVVKSNKAEEDVPASEDDLESPLVVYETEDDRYKQELLTVLTEVCHGLSVEDKKWLALVFGYTEPIMLHALAIGDRLPGRLREILRQKAAEVADQLKKTKEVS